MDCSEHRQKTRSAEKRAGERAGVAQDMTRKERREKERTGGAKERRRQRTERQSDPAACCTRQQHRSQHCSSSSCRRRRRRCCLSGSCCTPSLISAGTSFLSPSSSFTRHSFLFLPHSSRVSCCPSPPLPRKNEGTKNSSIGLISCALSFKPFAEVREKEENHDSGRGETLSSRSQPSSHPRHMMFALSPVSVSSEKKAVVFCSFSRAA